MRWDELFADLEGQLEAAAAAELAGEVADRTRSEVGRLRLVDRLAPAEGAVVRLHVRGGEQVAGRLSSVGSEWVLVDEPAGRQVLVPMSSVLGVGGLGQLSRLPEREGRVAARLGLVAAVRGLARDRVPVSVVLVDGTAVTGTVDRVGADFLEMAEHPPGEPRRRPEVSGVRAVPLAAVAAVRSA